MLTNQLHSARARFVATASVVFALLAIGGVTATPAMAAPVTLTITVQDNAQGGLLPNHPMTLESQDGSYSSQFTTSSSATFTATVEEGSYRLVPGGQYVPSAYFTISAGQTAISVPVTKPKIAGSIPAGAANGHTTVGVEIQGSFPSGTTYWYEVASFVVNSADGTFAYLLQVGTNTYRLNIKPDATVPYLSVITDPVVVDGTVDTVNIGAVSVPSAGSIAGTITANNDGAAVSGATVSASSGGATVASATTNSNGAYFIKLPATTATLTISAVATGFDNGSYGDVTVNAGNNYTVAAIDFALQRRPIQLTGNTAGGYVVDTYLYKKDGSGRYAQTPYGQFSSTSDFSFQNLPDGQYRIAFRDITTQRTLVWSSLTDNSTPVSALNGCYYDFTMSAATGSKVLGDVSLATEQTYPATCVNPAYTDGSDAAVTGTVLNYSSFGSIAFAQLFKVGVGIAPATLIDTSQLEYPSGSYSLTGVREAGDYYIKIVPYPSDPYLPTLLGVDGESAWAKDADAETAFAADYAFAVDPATSTGLTGHDVTLEAGALLTGYVRSDFGDTIDAGLIITNADDDTDTIYVPLDAGGSFAIVLPVGGSYTLLGASTNGDFIQEYWQNETDVTKAEVIDLISAGSYGPYNFNLSPSRPSLYGFLDDSADTDPVTVHLYQKDEFGLWQPQGEQDSNPDNQVYFGDLDEGDYRMRFERDGAWLSATDYSTGTVMNGGAAQAGPTCFVDIVGVTTGFPSAIYANFDSANQTEVCAAEPPSQGDVTGHLVSSPATGSVDVANKVVRLFGNTVFPLSTTTDAQGNFTFPNVRNGTYGLVVFSESHVVGQHDYYLSEEHTFAGGADLGDVEPLRFGNVSGDISNWDDATMAGATATVYQFADCGCGDPAGWAPVGIPVDIDSDGHFEAPGILFDGEYSVYIDFDGVYVDMFIEGGNLEPQSSFTGTAELDYTYPTGITLDLTELVSITGTAFYGDIPLEGGSVYAEDPLDPNSYVYAEVQADGTYELLVDPNDDYLISASYNGLMVQYYEGFNYDDDFNGTYTGTIVAVDEDPITGIDFSLIAPDNDSFYVYTGTDAGSPGSSYQFPGVEVHLYKYVVDGWEEIVSDVSTPSVELDASSGGGDYRLRFSKDGEWLTVEQYSSYNDLPPFDETDGYVALDSCFIDLADLPHGSDVSVSAILDPDGSDSGCGPEATVEHFEVVGQTVGTDTFTNAPISGQTVTLTNASTGYVFTETTAADGTFSFEGVTAGTYTLNIPSTVGTSGYTYVSYTETVVVDDDQGLQPIELTRYGNAEVAILNWDVSMAGATAQLQVEQSPGVWAPIGLSDTVDADGEFVIPGIAESGTYAIWLDYPDGYIDGYVADNADPTVTLELDGVAEEDIGGLLAVAFTAVSGTVRLGAAAVAGAAVTAETSSGYVFETTSTSTGSFSFALPAGFTVTLEANKAGLVRAIEPIFDVTYGPMTNIDLAMKYSTFFVETYTGADPLTVHLYKKVTGGWQEVASDTYTEVYLWATLGGDYRLRFSEGANWLAVSEYELDGNTVNPASDVCFIDVAPAVGGSEYELVIDPVTSATCAAEPAVVAPPATPGTSGSGTKKPVTFTAPVVTAPAEEVAPTSTPTPTPVPSESATADPDDATGVDKPDTASAPDLTWVFVLAGVLVLLVLAGGAVFLVRRRP